jgi:hypothetical protein
MRGTFLNGTLKQMFHFWKQLLSKKIHNQKKQKNHNHNYFYLKNILRAFSSQPDFTNFFQKVF